MIKTGSIEEKIISYYRFSPKHFYSGAGKGNRTPIDRLETCSISIILYPPANYSNICDSKNQFI